MPLRRERFNNVSITLRYFSHLNPFYALTLYFFRNSSSKLKLHSGQGSNRSSCYLMCGMLSLKYKCPLAHGAQVRVHSCLALTQKDKSFLSSKRKPHFKTQKWSWNEQKLNQGSRRGSKPRTTALATTSSNLLEWTGLGLSFRRETIPSEFAIKFYMPESYNAPYR